MIYNLNRLILKKFYKRFLEIERCFTVSLCRLKLLRQQILTVW